MKIKKEILENDFCVVIRTQEQSDKLLEWIENNTNKVWINGKKPTEKTDYSWVKEKSNIVLYFRSYITYSSLEEYIGFKDNLPNLYSYDEIWEINSELESMKVIATRDVKDIFTKDKIYTLTKDGFKNDIGYLWRNFLKCKGDNLLKKWNNYIENNYHMTKYKGVLTELKNPKIDKIKKYEKCDSENQSGITMYDLYIACLEEQFNKVFYFKNVERINSEIKLKELIRKSNELKENKIKLKTIRRNPTNSHFTDIHATCYSLTNKENIENLDKIVDTMYHTLSDKEKYEIFDKITEMVKNK